VPVAPVLLEDTGQLASLREVLEHYNRAPAAPAGHSELKPLNLTEQELGQLEAFLLGLSGEAQAPIATCLRCHPESNMQ
jgi:hypothetical protein